MPGLFVITLLLLLPYTAFARPDVSSRSLESVPAETQIVLAEGRAAIGPPESGGLLAAKQGAVALALRNAVEKTIGVYVAANSLTRNYQLVKDEILTRADGFAVLREIVRTERIGDTVRVVIRAEVSRRPLAERLKSLHLTRAFRVFVDAPESVATASLITALTEAGFPVIDRKADAEVIVTVTPRFVNAAETPLKTAVGPMTLHSVRGTVRITASRNETGETIGSWTASSSGSNISQATAEAETTGDAIEELAPRVPTALLILPANLSESMEIRVNGIMSASDAATLGEVMGLSIPGVQKVSRRSFAGHQAVYEVDILTDARTLLARFLETAPAMRRFHLRVTRETQNRIIAERIQGIEVDRALRP